jgi:hypothetical protein
VDAQPILVATDCLCGAESVSVLADTVVSDGGHSQEVLSCKNRGGNGKEHGSLGTNSKHSACTRDNAIRWEIELRFSVDLEKLWSNPKLPLPPLILPDAMNHSAVVSALYCKIPAWIAHEFGVDTKGFPKYLSRLIICLTCTFELPSTLTPHESAFWHLKTFYSFGGRRKEWPGY